MAKLISCAYCKGTGESRTGGKCAVCGGSGKVTIEEPARKCAYCNGTGVSKPRSLVTCPSCKGKGMVTVKEPAIVCPACHGTGKKAGSNLYCMKCGGAGYITKE
ncbi:MAG: zinc finger domain-containing protein [bacterium]|nr:zinc finger domain-containing protein [bacterium]